MSMPFPPPCSRLPTSVIFAGGRGCKQRVAAAFVDFFVFLSRSLCRLHLEILGRTMWAYIKGDEFLASLHTRCLIHGKEAHIKREGATHLGGRGENGPWEQQPVLLLQRERRLKIGPRHVT